MARPQLYYFTSSCKTARQSSPIPFREIKRSTLRRFGKIIPTRDSVGQERATSQHAPSESFFGISLEDEADEDTVCTRRVPKGLSPSLLHLSPPAISLLEFRIPLSSSRHADGRVDGTPRRHRVSRLSPSMGGFRLCTVSPWIQREEWIKFGDTPLRRVCNRMIPKQIFPLFRRLTCFDPISS